MIHIEGKHTGYDGAVNRQVYLNTKGVTVDIDSQFGPCRTLKLIQDGIEVASFITHDTQFYIWMPEPAVTV